MKKLVSFFLTFSLLFQSLALPVLAQTNNPPPLPTLISPFPTYTPQPTPPTGPKTLNYDSSGNLISDGERSITWDASDMPSSITKGNTVVNFVYDGSGARIAKIVKTNGKVSSATIYFGNLEKEMTYNSSGEITSTTITKYYFAGGKRIALRKTANNGTIGQSNNDLYFLHQDHLSSSTLFTNSTGGKQDSLLTYYPYGSDRQNWDMPVPSTTPPATNHLYTNQIKDPETDLYYYNARYYNPQTGSFISADTAGNKLNKYAYASNNPIMFNDPSGHDPWWNEPDPATGGSGGPLTLSPPIIQTPIGATGMYDSTVSYPWGNPIDQPDNLPIDEFMEALGAALSGLIPMGCAPLPKGPPPTLTNDELTWNEYRRWQAELDSQKRMQELQKQKSGQTEENPIIETLKSVGSWAGEFMQFETSSFDTWAGEFMQDETFWGKPLFLNRNWQLAFLGLSTTAAIGTSYLQYITSAKNTWGETGQAGLFAYFGLIAIGEAAMLDHDATLWFQENYHPDVPYTQFWRSEHAKGFLGSTYDLGSSIGYGIGSDLGNALFFPE